jgi:Helicase associated domain
MLQQLLEYKAAHGDCLVPSKYDGNLKLAKWVETQRYEYSKLQRVPLESNNTANDKISLTENASANQSTATNSKSKISSSRLTEQRISQLEFIGFEWRVKHKMKRHHDKQWDQMFNRLLAFKEANGNCIVPKRYPPDAKLGTWVHTQRVQYRKMMQCVNDKAQPDAARVQAKRYTEQPHPLAEDLSSSSDDDDEVEGEDGDVLSVDGDSDDVDVANSTSKDDKPSRLTESRRRRLDEIGFVWTIRDSEKSADQTRLPRTVYDEQWEVMFERLKQYKAVHGDCLVPKRYKDDTKLGTWVDTQRVQYKRTRNVSSPTSLDSSLHDSADESADDIESESARGTPKSSTTMRATTGLTEDRIQRLEQLGFVWSVREDWKKHYEELKQFKQRFGHCNVPARYTENRKLGIWVGAQRQQYRSLQQPRKGSTRRRPPPLNQKRIDLLNELGFVWTVRSRDTTTADSWDRRMQDLAEFNATHGHCRVPAIYPLNPELGAWVEAQREQYKIYTKGKREGETLSAAMTLTPERVKQLTDMGLVWSLPPSEQKEEELTAPAASFYAMGSIEPNVLQAANALVAATTKIAADIANAANTGANSEKQTSAEDCVIFPDR